MKKKADSTDSLTHKSFIFFPYTSCYWKWMAWTMLTQIGWKYETGGRICRCVFLKKDSLLSLEIFFEHLSTAGYQIQMCFLWTSPQSIPTNISKKELKERMCLSFLLPSGRGKSGFSYFDK